MVEKAQGHTPGPWGWFGSPIGNNLYLATRHSGRRYVMGFERWGMRGAQPNFQVKGIMVPSSELLKFEVGDPTITGLKQAKAHASVYRYDISGIDCADARLIAAAPDLLAALKAVLPHGWLDDDTMDHMPGIKQARAAIAAAESPAPANVGE